MAMLRSRSVRFWDHDAVLRQFALLSSDLQHFTYVLTCRATTHSLRLQSWQLSSLCEQRCALMIMRKNFGQSRVR